MRFCNQINKQKKIKIKEFWTASAVLSLIHEKLQSLYEKAYQRLNQ